jgi:CheY-like chemotaxis protein
MTSSSQATVDIALVGFSDHERLVMNSLFKVSGAYREWQDDQRTQPHCVLMDVDEETGRACADMELEHPTGAPIVSIGTEVAGKSIAAHIPRPFRWVDILNTLASVTKSKHEPADPGMDLSPATILALTEKPSNTIIPDVAPAAPAPAEYKSSTSTAAIRKGVRVYKTIGAVLVVNPNPKGWRHISAEVASLGYRVDHVSTGAAAALLLANFRYNCVILETQLPDQEGFELCSLLKKTEGRRRTATIILTNSRSPIDRIKSKYVGVDAFISKPVNRDELAKTLRRLLPEYVLQS